ncbi:MAG: cupin domain-containing protein [Chlorobi bacterium]|nr:MAG: Cupin domain protein [Chlorobi bacterium OLB7]MBK8912686.1 cupin domain-containing protein [Chlorobiota bacterium]MBX7216430.1 cupin domain-containing protein [Candidatus Kapabacteria bacterium]
MFLPNYRKLIRFSDEKMVKINLFESHRMFADLYCLRRGQSQKVHSHADNDKVYFVLEGECVCTLGQEERLLVAGESCAAPAGVPHGVRNDSETEAVLLVMMAPHP